MAAGRRTDRWECPRCGTLLETDRSDSDGGPPRLFCPGCGRGFRLRKVAPPDESPPRASSETEASGNDPLDSAERVIRDSGEVLGPWSLVFRDLALRSTELVFRAGAVMWMAVLAPCGGFVPILKSWLDDDLGGWKGAVETLGGAWPSQAPKDPDMDWGPPLLRSDGPAVFDLVSETARLLGCRAPKRIRLAFLPCCAAVVSPKEETLVVGLPLFAALSVGELRAVFAHELTHLARGDARRSSMTERFALGLEQAIASPRPNVWRKSPLRLWTRVCRAAAKPLISPIALGRETRADRSAAAIAGGGYAAESLLKVAVLQPLFRELLSHHRPNSDDESPNIYAQFRRLWEALPQALLDAIEAKLLDDDRAGADAHHPSLSARIKIIERFPDRRSTHFDRAPALALLSDPEAIEEAQAARLFGDRKVEPSVFHEAGS